SLSFLLCMFIIVFFFFFFQAEDGIRDDLVTGVQTCALPISLRERRFRRCAPGPCLDGRRGARRGQTRRAMRRGSVDGARVEISRSEERRVGKECRSGWSREQ